jgi:hypothetical protein
LEGIYYENYSQQNLQTLFFTFRTSVVEIIKQKEKLLSFKSKNQDEKRRRMKKSMHHDVEEKLFEWYSNLRAIGEFVNGPMIAEKATEIHTQLGSTKRFTASNGWLEKFKSRYGIKLCGIREFKMNNDIQAVEPYTNEIQKFLLWNNLSTEQIYNGDETDLLWRMIPNPDEKESAQLAYRDRVTILCCTNASGNHKLPLVCVGKRKASRLFNSIDNKNLPVIYFSQETAWMDQKIFHQWFHDYFVPSVRNHLESLNLPQTAVLFIDRSSSHPNDEQILKSDDGRIFCQFFPSNVKNLVQPMERGIFSNLKRYYRRELVLEMIKTQSSPSEFHKRISMKEAILKMKQVWDSLDSNLIVKSFAKLTNNDLNLLEDPQISNKTFEDLIQQIPECENYSSKRVLSWLNSDEAEPQRGEVSLNHFDEDAMDETNELVFLDFTTNDDENVFPTEEIIEQAEDEFNLENVDEIEHLQAESFDNEIMNDNPTCEQALKSLNNLLKFMQNDSQSLYKDVIMLQELQKKLQDRVEK